MGIVREPLAEGTEGAPHLGPERPRVYSHLSPEEKDRYNADIGATNILLQGLPKDIYTIINHYTDAKDIWNNVKMLLEWSELTKEDRKSQLYDDFEHFRQHKRETIHDYYVRFAKLINDMRNIKMTMSRMQVNSKFVNNMLPEWGRFVTAVKLNRGLRDSNYDQLYAYLKQHEAHANNLIENLTNTLALPTQSYKTFLPQTNNQLITSSNTRNQATVQDDRVAVQNVQGRQNRGQGTNPQGGGTAGYGGVQNRVGNANPGQARHVKCYNCKDNSDVFDFDVDEALTAQTMFMANMSFADPNYDEASPSYDSDILSEVHDYDHSRDAVCEPHDEDEMHDNVQLNHVVDSDADYTGSINMIPYDQYVKDNAVPGVQSNVSSILNDAYMMIYNDIYEPHAQFVPKTSRNTVVDNSLTVELATYKEQVELYERRARIKDPECVNHKVKIAPHDYSKEKFLATFTPQKQLTHEQIFWSQDLIKMKTEALKEHTTASRPIKALTMYPPNTPATLVPRVLPMKSQVKIHIFTLIQLFSEFDKTCKKRITPTRLTEGERGVEQTKECYLTEVILFFKTLKEHFEGIQKALTKKIKEMKDVFKELEADVTQNVVDRKHDEIERKNLLIANDNLIAECLSKEVFSDAMNYELNVARFTEMHGAHTIVEARCLKLEAELSNLR
nr:hypothetical protein [Tanacetum cinerariifolium]